MGIDSTYRASVRAEAQRLVASGGIPSHYASRIAKAEFDDIQFLFVEEAVSEYRLAHHPDAARLIANPSLIRGNRLFSEMNFEDRALFHTAVLKRAETIPLNEIRKAADFELKVLGNDPKIGDIAGEGILSSATLRSEVWQILLGRMLKLMRAGRRDPARGFTMLPPPSSPAFQEAILARFKIKAPVITDAAMTKKATQAARAEAKALVFGAWTQMPIWDEFLLGLFHTMMADGQVREPRQSPLDRHLRTLEQRLAWFDDLNRMGIGKKKIVHFFATQIISGRPDAKTALRAGGWLRRILPEITLSGLTESRRIEVLIGEVEKLHAMAPQLELQKFMNLLPGLVEPWTLAGLLATFDHRNIQGKGIELDSLSLYRAHTIMLWHAAPRVGDASAWLVTRLTDLVAKNNVKKYKSLDSFAKRKLGTTADALKAKIIELDAAGVDVKPLVEAIQAKFPRTKIGTPGGAAGSAGSAAGGSFGGVEHAEETAEGGSTTAGEEAASLDASSAGDSAGTPPGATLPPTPAIVPGVPTPAGLH